MAIDYEKCKDESVDSASGYTGSYASNDGVKKVIPYEFQGSLYNQDEFIMMTKAFEGDSLTMGPQVTSFEDEFAAYCGTKYALATSSCTTGLQIITDAIGIKAGDEVITTPITFIATSLPLIRCGAVPVFSEVDSKTFNLDPKQIEKHITEKTKAIYVVYYGGLMADMDPIMEIARRHNLVVVADAAHTPGAEYKGKKCGSIADLTAFSFHSLKNMTTCGEGGMVTTDNKEYADKLRQLRTMGVKSYANQKDYWLPYHYDVLSIDGKIGCNFRMNEVSAAFGRAQLRKLDSTLNATRIKIGRYLNEKLKDVEGIDTPYEDPNCKHVYYLYTLKYYPEKVGASKDDFIRKLYYKFGIQPIMHYKPSYLFSIYKERGYEPGLCPQTEDLFFNNIVNMPIHPRLTTQQLDYMADSIIRSLEELKAGK